MPGARNTAWCATRSAITEIRASFCGSGSTGVRATRRRESPTAPPAGSRRRDDVENQFPPGTVLSGSGALGGQACFSRAALRKPAFAVYRFAAHACPRAKFLRRARFPHFYPMPDVLAGGTGSNERSGTTRSPGGISSSEPLCRRSGCGKCARGPNTSRIRARLTAGPRSPRSTSVRSDARSAQAGQRTNGGIAHPDESKKSSAHPLARCKMTRHNLLYRPFESSLHPLAADRRFLRRRLGAFR
jgi:hypothetical protein